MDFSAEIVAKRYGLFRLLAAGMGFILLAVGIGVLLGWMFDVRALQSLRPDYASMKANTALSFACAGAAIALRLWRPAHAAARGIRLGLGIFVALLGFFTLLEGVAGVDFAIDQRLFLDPHTLPPEPACRMSEVTAFSFMLVGAGIAALERWPRRAWVAQSSGLLVGLIALVSLAGYLYNAHDLYAVKPFATLALHTTLAFLCCGLGLIFAEPEQALVARLAGEGATGFMLRRLLPVAVAFPLALGCLVLQGQHAGLYGTDFGLALFAVLNVICFSTFIAWTAASVERLEREHAAAARALAASEQRLRTTLDSIGDAVIATDPAKLIVRMNPVAERLTGWRLSEARGRALESVFEIAHEDTGAVVESPATQVLREATDVALTNRTALRSKDGKLRPIEASAAPIRGADREVIGVVLVFHDVTAAREAEKRLRQSEERLQQSQKMEAIGMFAGGIAHDFNNVLTVILSYGSALLERDSNDGAAPEIREILHAAERAADLTRQLLAFSRQQVLEPRTVDLNQVVSQIDRFIRRVIGENIELRAVHGADLWTVRVDPGQIDQIIMNLAVNGRDAMPNGGTLLIETANVELDAACAAEHEGVVPGPHVKLAVTDTGLGMDKGTRSRIFEPFFTTKPRGKGTGLGLSTVFGIVKQSGGHIWVQSEPGAGTTFTMYFPRFVDRAAPECPASPAKRVGGSETILLVEDEAQVRALIRMLLSREGYNVLVAEDAKAALRICEGHLASIHLLLTDVVMPGLSGRELAQRALPCRPSMKVLYMSGYAGDAIALDGLLRPGTAFLQKPMTPDALGRKVREVLDS